MTRVDDQFVKDMIQHTINNNDSKKAQDIISGFWGFLDLHVPKGNHGKEKK